MAGGVSAAAGLNMGRDMYFKMPKTMMSNFVQRKTVGGYTAKSATSGWVKSCSCYITSTAKEQVGNLVK